MRWEMEKKSDFLGLEKIPMQANVINRMREVLWVECEGCSESNILILTLPTAERTISKLTTFETAEKGSGWTLTT